jgi:hypothetical protein
MDYEAWIGTRWRAACNMRLPKGDLSPGDTFTYDAACAVLKLDPVQWLAVGNAQQLSDAPSLADTLDRRAGGKGRLAKALERPSEAFAADAPAPEPPAPIEADSAAPDAAGGE